MTTKHLSNPSRPFMDNDILRHLPCYDGRLFGYLRPWPYETWSTRFQSLLAQGVIEYQGPLVCRGRVPARLAE